MADLGNFRGLAVVKVADAGGTFHFSLSINDVDPSAAPVDQATWEGNPGDSFTLRLERLDVGDPANQDPTVVTITPRLPGGAQVGASVTVAVPASGGVVTRTLHFDDDPLSQVLENLRSGTLEMFIDVESAGGLQPWNANSRGANAGLLANTTHDHAEGRLRSRFILSSESLSNVALAGAEPASWAFPDSIFSRFTFSAQSYEAFNLRARILSAAAATERDQTLSAGSANRDFSWTAVGGLTGRVGDSMAAASEAKDVRLNFDAAQTFGGDPKFVFAATGHDASWTRDSDNQMTALDRITIDPRLTHTLHFQVGDDVFGMAKHDVTKQMLSTSSGFLWDKVKNARNEGQNSIGVTQTLDPVSSGTTQTAASTTSTQDGLVGVSGRMDWTESKPGGAWDWSIDITSPADIDADTHEVGGTDVLTMLAQDPRIIPEVYISPIAAGGEDDHLHPGDQMRVVFTLWNTETRKRLIPDAGSPLIVLIRYSPVDSRFEFLNSSNAWVAWTGTTTAADSFALSDSGDGVTFTRDFLSTAGWGTTDLVAAVIQAKVNSTPYTWKIVRELVRKNNQHSGYALDPIGLALSGILSQR